MNTAKITQHPPTSLFLKIAPVPNRPSYFERPRRRMLTWLRLASILLLAPRCIQADDTTKPAPNPSAYTISPMDMVTISVFQEEDLKSTLRVSNDGTIVFPFIGTVVIAGKSPDEAAVLIRDQLKPNYLINPQVSVTVTEFAKRRFTVLGQVQRSGSYDLPDHENVTLLEAIAMAGGYTRIADPARVTVKRKLQGTSQVTVLDAKKMAHENSATPFRVLPDDIITVAESAF